jgi:D-glycero-beta-D-manno-heptose 1-phosphate adenylyltransferase
VVTAFDPAAHVLNWREAVAWRAAQRGTVVFTNGVFDLLHPGHIDVLSAARQAGDALIVGLNSDASVRCLKGADRPIRPEADRAYVLAALGCVDAVTLFEQETPLELIRTVRPDVLVKGGDYTLDTVVGREDVEGWGGRVLIVPLTPGHSTTRIVDKLRGTNDGRS